MVPLVPTLTICTEDPHRETTTIVTNTKTMIMVTNTKTVKATNAGEETKKINKSIPIRIMITLKTVTINTTMMVKVTKTIMILNMIMNRKEKGF